MKKTLLSNVFIFCILISFGQATFEKPLITGTKVNVIWLKHVDGFHSWAEPEAEIVIIYWLLEIIYMAILYGLKSMISVQLK